VRHIAYGVSSDTLTLAEGEFLTVEYRVAARPIEVAGISVMARARPMDLRVESGTRFDGMTKAEVDAVRARISSMEDLLREGRVPGFNVTNRSGTLCVESNRSRSRRVPGECNMVAVVVDDVIQTDPAMAVTLMNPEDVESWQFIPAVEAGVQYGGQSGYGVLQIRTRTGLRPTQGYEGIARLGPRWALSGAVVARGSTTLHDGLLRVAYEDVRWAVPYVEKTDGGPGLELSVRWNSRSFGYLGVTGYGSSGSSVATYSFGGADRVFDRDYATWGFDAWWGAPLLKRGDWNASLALGPSFFWQRLSVEGHPEELADPGAEPPPSVQWTDHTWFSPGATFLADLGYDFGARAGVFVGISLRMQSMGGVDSWADGDEASIRESTGGAVEVGYDGGIAITGALRTGIRWYP
jgi:hypothetical protein